ncbi:MAG: glycosyltransferase family 2 protein [Vicinamibacterales bacterium]
MASPPDHGSAAPQVSIVLVSWNAAAVITPCLESLHGSGHQVIVVDNSSSDGTADLVARQFPWVHLLREPVNRGFAGGVNCGVRASSSDLVLLLNCDTVAHPGAVDRLSAVLRQVPGCGAVGGMLVDRHGEPQHGFAVRRFPTLLTWAVDLLLIDHLWPSNPITRRYLAKDITATAHTPVDVDQPAAACLMVERRLFDALQGMDEQFFPAWFEDVDLCRRMRDAGRRILFVPDAVFTHEGGVAMRQLGHGRFAGFWYRNLQRYVRTHQGTGALVMCKAFILIGVCIRLIASAMAGRLDEVRGYARAILDVFAFWPARSALS